MIIPVILAGGSGTRLWPLSRKLYPKQLLRLTNSYTMLQNTLLRVKDAEDAADPVIICNQEQGVMVMDQVKEIGITPSAAFLEPVGRNTAPALVVAAMHAASVSPDALILVLPADHLIGSQENFLAAVSAGAEHAAEGSLITFGVVPDRPETGYGYIRKGEPLFRPREDPRQEQVEAFSIAEFVEKPDPESAKRYVESGQYCWNSGMFMFSARTVLDELHQLAPEIASHAAEAYQEAQKEMSAWKLDAASFSACPADSIDYALMEKTGRGVMIALDAGWDDLGSWAAIWDAGEKDGAGNVVSGDVLAKDVRNCLLFSTHRLVAGVGLYGHVVVETPDAVLVVAKEKAQSVKHIADELGKTGRREAEAHTLLHLSWGQLELILQEEGLCIRRLRVAAGKQVLFSGHSHGSLSWMVSKGSGWLSVDGKRGRIDSSSAVAALDGRSDVSADNPGPSPLELVEVIRKMDKEADHLLP
ncbi:MAG: mannose-1-phosphate guanylyltransferase/mannose-6-phosphate isomerase [Desulfosalsimonadaceae bacterium]